MKQKVFIVIDEKKSGQESILAVKLTHVAASSYIDSVPGTKIVRLVADKEVFITQAANKEKQHGN